LALLGGGTPAPAAAPEVTSAPAAKDEPKAASPAAPTSAKIIVKSQGNKSSSLKEFEKYLLRYNVRTSTIKGYIPFTHAEDLGNGDLNLTVTNQWLDKSKARQKSSLITLYTRWKKANNSPDVRVHAVDPSGNQVAQYPK